MSTGTMWTCPGCGRMFANSNQTHSCARLGDVGPHFTDTEPAVRATFERILAVVRAFGPVDVLPEKSRIALHARMSFAAFMPRQSWLNGHLVLARSAEHPTFVKIEIFSPRNVLHAFRLHRPQEVDEAFERLVGEAYEVGLQHHLERGEG